MHLALLAAVTWGWSANQTTKRVYTPKFIEAKLVTLKAQTPKKAAPKKKTPKKIDLAAKRKAEAARKKRADAKRKAAARKKENERKAAEAKKLDAQKKAAERAAALELKRLELEREAEQKKETQRQQQAQDDFFSELEEEDELMIAEEAEQLAQSYASKIASKIEQNWNRPPSARKGMKCELLLSLVPTGKVVNVSIKKGSGNAAFDRSAELAAIKAEQFPELQGMDPLVFERYFRQLIIVFNPTDLRL